MFINDYVKCKIMHPFISEAVRLSQGGSFERPTCSNSQIEKVVREWFRTAADRDGGRQRRANVSAHV